MNKYMIIRSDNKSISPPMSKHEAIIKLKEYNKKVYQLTWYLEVNI